mmetsp:Transcript_19175/g.49187  ORF Transcript_19175/g.49187 Transcript_19175/m.49187 type:complete len:214 (-) Transcript_19175:257-898(-)
MTGLLALATDAQVLLAREHISLEELHAHLQHEAEGVAAALVRLELVNLYLRCNNGLLGHLHIRGLRAGPGAFLALGCGGPCAPDSVVLGHVAGVQREGVVPDHAAGVGLTGEAVDLLLAQLDSAANATPDTLRCPLHVVPLARGRPPHAGNGLERLVDAQGKTGIVLGVRRVAGAVLLVRRVGRRQRVPRGGAGRRQRVPRQRAGSGQGVPRR